MVSSRVWSDCSCFECINQHDGLLFLEKDSSKCYEQVFSALAVETVQYYLVYFFGNYHYLIIP